MAEPAYRRPPQVGCRVGDLSTVRAGGGKFGPERAAGHLRAVDNQLVCVADGFEPSGEDLSITNHATRMAQIYDAYDAELAHAWRQR